MTQPTLQAGVPIVDSTGAPTQAFLIAWQNLVVGLSNTSGASMPTPPPVVVMADYTGAFLAGEMPRSFNVQRLLNGKDVSSLTRWFISVVSGTISATISQSGVVTITALSTDSVLQIKSVRDGVTLFADVNVTRQIGSAPTGSGAGSASSVSTFTAINATTAAPISAAISITVGASGTVTLSAPLTVKTAKSGSVGTFPVYGKWQWLNGATWQDVGTEVQSNPDCALTSADGTVYTLSPGSLTVNSSQGSLTSGSTQQFRLAARNGAGTRTMYFTGTATATTS